MPLRATGAPARLAYVDWMRGLAVVFMMQTHAYDSWLEPEARRGAFFGWSRLIGGYPGPIFLFLAGLSLALLAEARYRKGAEPAALRRDLMRRGAKVLGYAVLFRIWMFTAGGFARPADLLRVDVLNCIGLSMLLVAAPVVLLGIVVVVPIVTLLPAAIAAIVNRFVLVSLGIPIADPLAPTGERQIEEAIEQSRGRPPADSAPDD